MTRLSEVTFGQIADSAGRYKPAAVTLAVVLVVVSALPAQERLTNAESASDALGTPTPAAAASSAPAPAASDDAIAASDLDGSLGADVGNDSFTTTFDFSGGGHSTSSGLDDFDSSSDIFIPDSPTSSDDRVTPLRIVGSAWATRTAGTPLAANGVPAGSLPVGNRIGQNDKTTFLRLSGTSTVLSLPTDPAGGRSETSAVVAACAINVASWEEGEARSFSQSPTWDAGRCATGRRADDGTWTFDLSSVDASNGVALVPGSGAPLDFQVAFRRNAQ